MGRWRRPYDAGAQIGFADSGHALAQSGGTPHAKPALSAAELASAEAAGGPAAFEAFFSGMPADTNRGMAFVLVQHLAPDHQSILPEPVKRSEGPP